MTEPLRDLAKSKDNFKWTEERTKAFNDIKDHITKAPILKYYDVNKECTISVDASSTGVGAVLLQNQQPVAYASKSLTQTQRNWAQIEKELYAILFGCERFEQYVMGRFFRVESDHKPLIPIMKKNLSEIPVRLQKMRMRLQRFDLQVEFKPGKELKIADTLSRAHLNVSEDDIDNKLHVLELKLSENMTDKRREQFVRETNLDPDLQTLLKFIRQDWPKDVKNLPDEIKAYHTFNQVISEYKGLLFKNKCVIVPQSMRRDIIAKLHYCHLGIEKTKNRARELVFWPGITKDIENVIKDCKICLKFQNRQQSETLRPSELPQTVWEEIGTDLFYLQQRAYLIVVDYFSKYVEVLPLKDETSETTIKALKSCFVRWGIPCLHHSTLRLELLLYDLLCH
ncbi:MAG: hypothetical protein I4N51_04480 [Acinetobacter sp.]|nr:hypothetical protein [Acinetobacter sp.]